MKGIHNHKAFSPCIQISQLCERHTRGHCQESDRSRPAEVLDYAPNLALPDSLSQD